MAQQDKKSQQTTTAEHSSEERFYTLINHNADGILVINNEGRIRFANPAAEAMLGRTAAELQNAMFGFPLTAGETTEIDLLPRGGGSLVAEMRVVETAWEDAPAFLASLRDVTARKLAEEAARVEAHISGSLVNVGRELTTMLETSLVLDRLCQRTAEILDCDCSRTLWWKPAEEAYVPIATFGDSAEQWQTLRLTTIPQAEISELLAFFQHQDVVQLEEVMSTRAAQILFQGFTSGLCMRLQRGQQIVGLQIASRRKPNGEFADSQIRLAQGIAQIASLAFANTQILEELHRANRFKTDFLALMSHELRTPLSVIMGYGSLLLEEEFGRLKTNQRGALHRIQRSARDLLTLIDTLLDVSLLETQNSPLSVQTVQLSQLFAQLEQSLFVGQEKPLVRVEWNISPALPFLQTDSAKLKLILKHLIANAVKFTIQGHITITAGLQGAGVEICVSDSGIGITPEALPSIFEAFRQAKDPLHRMEDGLGLGLYIVRRLTELLGGTVSVESEPQRGSTFRLWMPTLQESASFGFERSVNGFKGRNPLAIGN